MTKVTTTDANTFFDMAKDTDTAATRKKFCHWCGMAFEGKAEFCNPCGEIVSS